MTKLMNVNPLMDPEGAQSGSASYDSESLDRIEKEHKLELSKWMKALSRLPEIPGKRNSALGTDFTSRISFCVKVFMFHCWTSHNQIKLLSCVFKKWSLNLNLPFAIWGGSSSNPWPFPSPPPLSLSRPFSRPWKSKELCWVKTLTQERIFFTFLKIF